MENATKALEMAGSVLIGLLILGCLVFAYSRLSDVKRTEQLSEKTQQAADFNKEYLAYDRKDLYGSDIFSIANQIMNYNKKEHDAKDYTEITIEVKVSSAMASTTYFKNGTYTAEEISNEYKNLSREIENTGKKQYYKKAVSYWSKYGTSSRLDNQIHQEVSSPTELTIQNLKNDINMYNDLIGEQKDMARREFKCEKVEYDTNTGRVVKMKFVER